MLVGRRHPVHDVLERRGEVAALLCPGTSAPARKLVPGQTFAFDGFYGWLREDGTTKTISVEEMVVITEDGAEWMIPPQEEWVLVGGGEQHGGQMSRGVAPLSLLGDLRTRECEHSTLPGLPP
jgi:hypothetical protein